MIYAHEGCKLLHMFRISILRIITLFCSGVALLVFGLGIWIFVHDGSFAFTLIFHKVVLGPISGTVIDAKTGELLPNIPVKISFTCPHGVDPYMDINGGGMRCEGVSTITTRTDANGKFLIGKTRFSSDNRSISYVLTVNHAAGVTTTVNASGSLINDFATMADGISMSALPSQNGYHAFLASDYYDPPYSSLNQPKHYNISLLGTIGSVDDCAALSTDDSQEQCLNVLAYNAAEGVWKHGGVASYAETSYFFEDYFVRKFTTEMKKTCVKNPNDNDCIMLQATISGDISMCNTLAADMIQKCKMWVAVFSKNGSVCNTIPRLVGEYIRSPYTDGKCLVYSAIWSQDRSICDQLNALYEGETRRTGRKWNEAYLMAVNQCWTEFAIKSADPDLCTKIPDVDTKRDDCMKGLSNGY